jgi:ribosomal protein S18 acetylase RimI-like enzyme
MPTEERGGATSTPPVAIRPATAADADFIRGLTARFAEAGPPPWREPERMARFFDRAVGEIAGLLEADYASPGDTVLIATEGDTALGFIHLQRQMSALTGEGQGYVNALAVAPEAEGRGVGRALMAAGEAWARERGYRYLALETFGGNRRARAFYTRLGFEEETLKLVKTL